MSSSLILQQLVSGVAIGMAYGLIAIGYCMVYGVLRFINFGHAAVASVGAVIAYFTWVFLMQWLPMWPSFLLAVVVAVVGAVVLGLLLEKVAYKPTRGRGRLTTFMSSVGASLLLLYGSEFFVGPAPRPTPALFPGVAFEVGGAVITGMQIFMLSVAVVLLVSLQWFVTHTRIGKAIRATSEDMDAAYLMGINVDVPISVTFAIGSCLGTISMIMVGVYYRAVWPLMGWNFGIKGFIASVAGGIGSIPGAVIGGMLLGMAENLGAGLLSSSYRDIIAFTVLILVMLLRPKGIFAKEQRSSL